MGGFLFVNLLWGLSPVASPQVQLERSGTAVFLWWRKDRVIVSADSRARQGPTTPPDDKDCKIEPLSTNFIFASSGVRRSNVQAIGEDGFSFNWDTHAMAQEVFNAVRSHRVGSEPQEVATAWSSLASKTLNSVPPRFREVVRANTRIGTTKVMFVGLTDSSAIDVYVANITNNAIEFTSVPIRPPMDQIYALAKGDDILKEFASQSSERSKREMREWESRARSMTPEQKDASLMVQLIRWTILYDTSGGVGGSPEEIDLKPHGTVRWLQKCPR
ncbi:MAG: hypothetical protein WA211_12655 [Candidatus Acidiferrales bacterium]